MDKISRSFICCNREDENDPSYLNPCNCPQFTIIRQGTEQRITNYPNEFYNQDVVDVGIYTSANAFTSAVQNTSITSNFPIIASICNDPDYIEENTDSEQTVATKNYHDQCDIIKRTARFAILCRSLAIGVRYRGRIPIFTRTSETGLSGFGPYIPSVSPYTFSFTSTKRYEIIGGTLEIPEQDFIEGGYSPFPGTYGLTEPNLVINPTIQLPFKRGLSYWLGDGVVGGPFILLERDL